MRFNHNKKNGSFTYSIYKHPIYEAVEIKQRDSIIVGYKLELTDVKIDKQLLVKSFLSNDFSNLLSIPADFIFVCKDKTGITVVNDIKGSFNFYFGEEKDTVCGDIFIENLFKSFDHLSLKKINILWFLTLIDTNYNSDTIFSEISKQQPGYITKISNNGTTTLPPQIPTTKNDKQLISEEEQAEFLNTSVINIIEDYRRIIKRKKQVPVFDLSSGLDSSLLCAADSQIGGKSIYRSVFDFSSRELPENTKIIDEFIQKHDLRSHHYVNIKTDYSLENNRIYKKDSYLHNIASYESYKSLKNIVRFGSYTYIPGFGGNQIFSTISTEQYYKDYIYNFYYKAVRFSQTTGIYNYLRKESQDTLLDKYYYQKLQPTFSYLEDTVLNNIEATFENSFKLGVVRLTPYTDPRLAVPIRNAITNHNDLKNSQEVRKSVLKKMTGSVYLQNQFYPTNIQRYRQNAIGYITENKDLIDKLIKDDVLQELKLVDLKMLCKDCAYKKVETPEIGYFYYHLKRLSAYIKMIEKSTKVKFTDA